MTYRFTHAPLKKQVISALRAPSLLICANSPSADLHEDSAMTELYKITLASQDSWKNITDGETQGVSLKLNIGYRPGHLRHLRDLLFSHQKQCRKPSEAAWGCDKYVTGDYLISSGNWLAGDLSSAAWWSQGLEGSMLHHLILISHQAGKSKKSFDYSLALTKKNAYTPPQPPFNSS